MIPDWDYARLINSALFLITAYSMLQVTWRLARGDQWYTLVGRIGITVVFLGLTGSSVLAITNHAPYTVFTFVITTGLGLASVGFSGWAHRLPRRPFRHPKPERQP